LILKLRSRLLQFLYLRKRVRFTTPIQKTDRIEIETYDNGAWIVGGFATLSTGTTVGMSWQLVTGSSTDIDVSFGSAGYAATVATAGGAWSTIAASENYKWRVRKVSGGASVGYPISPANLVKSLVRYSTATAGTYNNTPAPVDFGTKTYDLKSEVTTGVAWKFTARESGYYRVSANITWSNAMVFTAGKYADFSIWKGGSIWNTVTYRSPATNTNFVAQSVNDIVQLNAGEYIDIRLSTDVASAELSTVGGGGNLQWVNVEQIN